MKKFITIILTLFLMISVFATLNNFIVHASEEIEFYNFDFDTDKIRENGTRKVKISISFTTKEEIRIDNLVAKIENQTQTINLKNQQPIKTDDSYQYDIEFTIENWQVGTVKLEINYFLIDSFEKQSKIFYIPGGRWIETDLSIGNSVLMGVIAAVTVASATLIIIEINKKDILDEK